MQPSGYYSQQANALHPTPAQAIPPSRKQALEWHLDQTAPRLLCCCTRFVTANGRAHYPEASKARIAATVVGGCSMRRTLEREAALGNGRTAAAGKLHWPPRQATRTTARQLRQSRCFGCFALGAHSRQECMIWRETRARRRRGQRAGAADGGPGRRGRCCCCCWPAVCHRGWLGGGGGCWCRRRVGRRCAVGRVGGHLRCSALLCSGPCMRRQLARVADGYLQLSTLLRTSPKAKTVALQLASLHKHHLPRRVWPPARTTGRARPCQAASGCRLID